MIEGSTTICARVPAKAVASRACASAAACWLALSVAKAWAIPAGVEQPVLAAVALAVFLGHLWPVFHGFRGGKGVATAAGCQLVAQCDLAVAAEGARFAVSGVNFGLFCR